MFGFVVRVYRVTMAHLILVQLKKLISTPSISGYKMFWLKSNCFKFDQVCKKSRNICNPRQIYYKNVFNYWFDETNLVLYLLINLANLKQFDFDQNENIL